METSPASLKGLCNRIADAAVAGDGEGLARLLRLAGLIGGPPPAADGPGAAGRDTGPSEPAATDRVGIWERARGRGQTSFVRRMDKAREWNYWANLGRIEAKDGRKRVVLIGESVARGYLYDPQFTPAMVLQAFLARRLGEAVEVIDLARTNLGLEVGELATSALLLEPDAVIIFAGNNWNLSPEPPLSQAAVVDAVLREQGIAGLKLGVERNLAAKVTSLVRDVADRYRAQQVPLVWMIPEFNLGDWRDPITTAPHLAGTGNRDWLEHWQAARRAGDAGDLQQAVARAQRMVELDGGTCVTGLYLLAEHSRRSGDLQAQRRYLELARDAVIWDSSHSISPRTYGVAQEALRAEATRCGYAVVDLPQVFHRHLGGAIPDRRLFLDYCHLGAVGMRVAMAAAAAPLLRALTGVEAPPCDLLSERTAPGREVEASAAFLAAVHNAHWWQSIDVIRYFCSAAVQASPSIASAMTSFVEIQTRRAPMLMCRAAEEIAGLASPQLQHYLLRYNQQRLDAHLIDAIVAAVSELGIDVRHRQQQIRRQEHDVARDGGVDLLEYYYCSSGLQPQEVMWVMPRGGPEAQSKENHFYRAYGPESRFAFDGEAGRPALLRLTCRLPGAAPARGALVLWLNGRPQARLEAGGDWETWEVSVPGDAVVAGLNEVAITWPLPEFPGQQALASLAQDRLAGGLPDLYPCFGEIHSFRVIGGQPASGA